MSSAAEGENEIRYTADFKKVLQAEYAEIDKRRSAPGIGIKASEELFGVALSGGGIRSACFCLGALQALDRYNLIPRIDYLSTVSGGGYIGSSMIAEMSRQGMAQDSPSDQAPTPQAEAKKLTFPFARGAEGVRDSALVGHIRDNSRYLAPKKFGDLLVSLAIMLRGLAVNFLMIVTAVLPFSILIVLANPTTAHLDHNVLLDLYNYVSTPPATDAPQGLLRGVLADPFLLTKTFAIALGLFLVGWAVWRSFIDTYRPSIASRLVEPKRRGAKFSASLFTALLFAFVVEVQPIMVGWATDFLQWLQLGPRIGLASFGSILAAAATVATLREKLAGLITKALNIPTLGARLQALFARAAVYAAALAIPLLVYVLFLTLAVWGIQDPGKEPSYQYAPAWLLGVEWTTWLFVGLLVLWAGYLIVAGFSYFGRVVEFAKSFFTRWGASVVVVFVGSVVLIICSAIATRTVKGVMLPTTDPQWIVLFNYGLLLLCVGTLTVHFAPNANSLHRLYRDRLSDAFNLGLNDKGDPLRLDALHARAPYMLINGTLNVRQAADRLENENEYVRPGADPTTDPAQRGRNAEFFLFSRLFVGSDLTGYAGTSAIGRAESQLDLATAAAISGAAVSSSMGRLNIGLLGPTLALLNLRLGFWLTNPKLLPEPRKEGRGMKAPAKREWYDILGFYLFAEAFGRMRSDNSYLYITDGGHIDNLGLYQLLKRRCKLIIVIDAEADSGLNFGAFCDVQRFARIDLGGRISLDWRPIRDAALKRLADRSKAEPQDSDAHQRHFAIGRITYENDKEEGVLLYVKASVTGDEPDYVLDYERRYPNFPYESTGDQFFSEEQMEAYRALGFHATRLALEERAPKPVEDGAGRRPGVDLNLETTEEPLITQMKNRLGIKGLVVA